jgi:hypothetical protein
MGVISIFTLGSYLCITKPLVVCMALVMRYCDLLRIRELGVVAMGRQFKSKPILQIIKSNVFI